MTMMLSSRWIAVVVDDEVNTKDFFRRKKIEMKKDVGFFVFCICISIPGFNRPSKWWVGWAIFTFILTPADLVIWIIENVFSK